MAEVLLEVVGPNGNIQAIVESDDQVCYFYMFGAPETDFGVRSVWVRNHCVAPDQLDTESMKAGRPPRNPAQFCRHPEGLPPLDSEQLQVVWLPEGNGAALREGELTLAIIPPWSGTNGFHGYSREAVGEGPVAWELDPDNVLLERFREAASYWAQWDDDKLWSEIQPDLLSRIEDALGKHANYYAIDGGQWPPKALLRIPRKDSEVLITIGVCLRPQPSVEMYCEQPELLRRVELGAVLPSSWSDTAIKGFAGYLSGQTNLPWHYYTWMGPGHTVPCDAWQNRKFTFALLSPKHAAVPEFELGLCVDDPVNVLWFLPVSAAERKFAMDEGSDRLQQQLAANRWQQA